MIRYRSTWFSICQIVMCSLIIVVSCREPKERDIEDLSAYYLPHAALDDRGLVYSYRNLVDPSFGPEVWQHSKTSEGHITSINYDQSQQVVQKQYERVVSNGVLIDSLVLYASDTLGRTISYPVRVISPHRFPFQVADTAQVWLSKFEWWQPGDLLHVVLQRRRQFEKDTVWSWQGKEVPAVKFSTTDILETEEVGWTTSEWKGTEIYGRGVGLIYYRRDISESMRLEYELQAISPAK